uniref:Uncharacterized protein n=1 Tax=Octopus bimaculoides TaxID=37653 RepID=A0A0L8HA58_OCTBM
MYEYQWFHDRCVKLVRYIKRLLWSISHNSGNGRLIYSVRIIKFIFLFNFHCFNIDILYKPI